MSESASGQPEEFAEQQPATEPTRVLTPRDALDSALFALEHGDPDPQRTHVEAGSLLEHYRITREIGRGGMGVVYEALDEVLKRRVALKFLAPRLTSDTAAINRFLREARSVARLNHPNVVNIYDVHARDAHYFLVLEYVDGQSAADMVDTGPLPWQEAANVIMQACRGLAAAHAAGIIHRDIKPANVLRSRDGQVKLTDFGLALDPGVNQGDLTASGRVIGTPSFMSPEQCHNKPLDARSDIYSMGATLYALLTGVGPFDAGASPTQVMFAHCYADVPDPREHNPTLPPEAAAIIRCAMAKHPDERYPTADALREDLEKWLAGEPPSVTGKVYSPINRPESFEKPSTLEPAIQAKQVVPARHWVALAGCVAVIALAALAVNLTQRGSEPPARAAHPPSPDRNPHAPPEAASIPPASNPASVKIGLLHSQTGILALSEELAIQGARMAVDEINSAELLGTTLEVVEADGASNPEEFARLARQLIESNQVSVIFGCWTSASRKAVKPVVEQLDNLLVYPSVFEGLENSDHILYVGALPNQHVLPAVNWAYGTLGNRFVLVGSDEVYSHCVHLMIRHEIEKLGGQVLFDVYTPLTPSASDFDPLIEAIRRHRPSAILSTVLGMANQQLYTALRAGGIQSDSTPTLSFRLGENAIRILEAKTHGDYASSSYFTALAVNTPQNVRFVTNFQNRYGRQRFPTDTSAASYLGVWLWATAAREARSFEPRAVRKALRGLKFDAPEGPVQVDTNTLMLWKRARVAQISKDFRFEVFYRSPQLLQPVAFPPPRSPAGWVQYLDELQLMWDGNWQRTSR